MDVEDRTHFSLITPRTAAPHVLVLLLPYADHDLDDTDWVVARMKADCSSHNPSDGEPADTGFFSAALGKIGEGGWVERLWALLSSLLPP